MGFVKEPIGIDLVVEPSALTTEDRHQLSAIIAQYKLTKEIPQLSQKKIRPTRTKTGLQAPKATFPWGAEPKAVWLTAGLSSTSDATGFHELGHTLGLLHTFSPEVAYSVPVSSGLQDYPNNQGGRELVIRDTNFTKLFPYPNSTFAGDRVSDTPPGCDSDSIRAVFYPSSATIAGCLDGDPITPCVNGCNDFNPNTPCINGCSWDYGNCTYTGDYRDYNFDLIVDSLEILVRNIMSYTGSCRQNFTPGQVERADQIANLLLNDYYQEQLCDRA